MYDPRALTIYTDGSALKNPGGPGGIAGIADYPEHLDRLPELVFRRGYHSTTNNRMELRACIEALSFVREQARGLRVTRAFIRTDSQYVCQNYRRALAWKKAEWTSADGRPIENPDLWRDFLSAWANASVRVEIEWVRGKSSDLTREVDRKAKEAARSPTHSDFGFRPGTVSRKRSVERSASTPFPARGQTVLIRIYRIQLRQARSTKVHRIFFDLFSDYTSAFDVTHHAYLPAAAEIHRHRCYSATFNSNPRYPFIEALEEVPCPSEQR